MCFIQVGRDNQLLNTGESSYVLVQRLESHIQIIVSWLPSTCLFIHFNRDIFNSRYATCVQK